METIVHQALEQNILQVSSCRRTPNHAAAFQLRFGLCYIVALTSSLKSSGLLITVNDYDLAFLTRIKSLFHAQAVKNVEDQLDNTLQALDNLDPDDIENMRQRRLKQMKRDAAQKQEWARRGHGNYREIFGEKGFFAEMKGEERMVCHFYRENWPCKV
jgi:hypothetical protein